MFVERRTEHTFSLEHRSCSGKALSTSTQPGTSATDNGRTKAVAFWFERPAKFTVFDIVLDGGIIAMISGVVTSRPIATLDVFEYSKDSKKSFPDVFFRKYFFKCEYSRKIGWTYW